MPVVVAIPARDEIERITTCLSALARQRDDHGSPLPDTAFSIVVFANNCTDGTEREIARWSRGCPYPVRVVSESAPSSVVSAGWARKRAMDLAAESLASSEASSTGSYVLTTDADTAVSPTWITSTLAAMDAGADAVFGYLDIHPGEMIALGPAFLARSRIEDTYLRILAEIESICDPRAEDPWPNHRYSSGASLAVRLSAYQAIGGLPQRAVGEDAALARALAEAGFKVRHPMSVHVATSCRFDGRASGGAAAAIRDRHRDVDLPCGEEIEPALRATQRALDRRRARTGLSSQELSAHELLRPSELPREIARGQRILRLLRSLRAVR